MLRQDFFSGPCPWLSCLLQHKDLCCDKLDLANLSSFSISVVTEFSSVAKEFYQLAAFIITIENFFVVIEILPSIFHYVTTGIFFVAIPLVLFFNFYVATKNSLSRQNSPQPHVLFVTA